MTEETQTQVQRIGSYRDPDAQFYPRIETLAKHLEAYVERIEPGWTQAFVDEWTARRKAEYLELLNSETKVGDVTLVIGQHYNVGLRHQRQLNSRYEGKVKGRYGGEALRFTTAGPTGHKKVVEHNVRDVVSVLHVEPDPKRWS